MIHSIGLGSNPQFSNMAIINNGFHENQYNEAMRHRNLCIAAGIMLDHQAGVMPP
jgi:hypothetical protein